MGDQTRQKSKAEKGKKTGTVPTRDRVKKPNQ